MSPERTQEQLRRVLLVAQILDAEQEWVSSEQVHQAYSARVGKICQRTIMRDLRLLVWTGIAEERLVGTTPGRPRAEFRFEGWPESLEG